MLLLALLACHRDEAPAGDVTLDGDADVPTVKKCSDVANLELVPLDVWGRDAAESTLSLDRTPQFVADPDAGPGVRLLPYGDAAFDLQVRWQLPDHDDVGFVVRYDGSGVGGFTVVDASGYVAVGSETRQLDGEACPVFTVFAGAEHDWFAPGGRAPGLNRAELLRDGQDFWAAVSGDLDAAERRVTWATWWWESAFELVRAGDHVHSSRAERDAETVMAGFQRLGGVERRVLINRFWSENSDYAEYLNTDTDLRDAAEASGDRFEVVLQGNNTEVPVYGRYEGEAAPVDFPARVRSNPRYGDRAIESGREPAVNDLTVDAASWHQKVAVIDGSVAYVSGMNTKGTDWDTNDHGVYDARRMAIDATTADREDVAAGLTLPDYGPRKDYGVRLEGPAARDVEEIIQERWAYALDTGAMYANRATAFSLDAPPDEPADGIPVQVVATMPEPWAEMSIAETHARAFANAEELIFIEDQYFRSTDMNEVLIAAMTENPELRLVVVTKPMADTDPGAQYTWLSDATFRGLFPDRYLLLQLRSVALVYDTEWLDEVLFVSADMDVHSKLRIVDDRYLSVGSCNFNNRGYLFEGEMDVAVWDERFVTDARDAVLANIVGEEWAGALTGNARNDFEVLRDAATENQQRWSWWTNHAADLDFDEAADEWARSAPSGFVYPLSIDPTYEWDVGPDLF